MQLRPARKQSVPAARFATLLVTLFACAASGADEDVGVAAVPAAATERKAATTIDAERIEGVADLELSAQGKVELHQEDLRVFSDALRYNQEFGRLEADGGVRLEQGGDRFFGPRLFYDLREDTGVLEAPRYLIRREQDARGGAAQVEFLGKDRLRMKDATFTTCQPGNDAWQIEAESLELDYEAEEGRARWPRVRFFDTPILAFPYATFPLERRRKTGLLTPYYSQNTLRGFEFGVPFYWNIAPEQDLTLTPVYMTKRGAQLKSQYRYLGRRYNGELKLEVLPNDQAADRSRTGFSLLHSHQFTPNLLGRLDLNRVSDDRYFVDFASEVRQVSISNLQQEGYLQYNGRVAGHPYSAQARVQTFQTLQDPLAPIVPPYDRVPQLNFSTGRNDLGGLFDLSLPAEYVRFTHPTLIEGARTTLSPTLAMPLLAPGWFVTPRLGLRSVHYDLSSNAPGQLGSLRVDQSWVSVDAGLVFDRPTRWFGQDVTQTFEPRAFYVYAPARDYAQVPLFDTALADFNYAQIFSENRFSGGDRFGDADQVTLAATSRLLGLGGQEVLRGTLAQRFYFKGEEVGLTPSSPLRTSKSSDILASLGGRFARHWTFDAGMQYDESQRRTSRYSASLRYSPEIAKVISASYRFNRDALRQLDVAGQWPLTPGWYFVGRYNYSFFDGRLVEGLAGIEYNGGCWVFRAVLKRIQAATQVSSTALFIQLELNGIGTIGSDDTVTLLKRSVPGYSVTNPRDQALVPPGVRRPLPFEQVY